MKVQYRVNQWSYRGHISGDKQGSSRVPPSLISTLVTATAIASLSDAIKRAQGQERSGTEPKHGADIMEKWTSQGITALNPDHRRSTAAVIPEVVQPRVTRDLQYKEIKPQ